MAATDGQNSNLPKPSDDEQQLLSNSNADEIAGKGEEKKEAVSETHCNKLHARFLFVLENLSAIDITRLNSGVTHSKNESPASDTEKSTETSSAEKSDGFYGIKVHDELVIKNDETGCAASYFGIKVPNFSGLKRFFNAQVEVCPALTEPDLASTQISNIKKATLSMRCDGQVDLDCYDESGIYVTYKIPTPKDAVAKALRMFTGLYKKREFVTEILFPRLTKKEPQTETDFNLEMSFPNRRYPLTATVTDKTHIRQFCRKFLVTRALLDEQINK
jgi:hypothetical protein